LQEGAGGAWLVAGDKPGFFKKLGLLGRKGAGGAWRVAGDKPSFSQKLGLLGSGAANKYVSSSS